MQGVVALVDLRRLMESKARDVRSFGYVKKFFGRLII